MLSLFAFLLYLVYPAFGWIYYSLHWQRRVHPVLYFLALCATGYICYLVAIALHGWELARDLRSHDLDGSGDFGEDKQTPAMRLSMQRYANDTGRMYAPLVAAPITLVWVAVNFAFVTCGQWIFRRRQRTTATV